MASSSTNPQNPSHAVAAGETLFRLAEGLHAYGIPAPRLEGAIHDAAARRGLRLELLSNPTALFCSFSASEGPENGREIRMARVEPGEVDLGRLIELEGVLAAFEEGRLEPEQALGRLEDIRRGPAAYGSWIEIAAFATASATAAAFFRGSALDIGASALLGLGTGALAAASRHRAQLAAVFEPLASLLVALLTVAAARLGAPLGESVVLLSGLIVLVPGYTLTVAMTELATRHLTSGTTRLFGAIGTLLGMGFGVGIGRALGGFVPALAPPRTLPPLAGTEPIALVLASLAFLVLFRAPWRDAGRIVFAGALAFFGARLGASVFGPELGVCLGALALGAASNLDALWTRRPASVMLVPGIMLLVPGGIGFQSVSSFLARDALSGVEAAFRMALVAMALVAGLLAANVAVRPRGAL
ncbi:MAG: threonine/serine exporter family protein [Planctomycetota bacterium]